MKTSLIISASVMSVAMLAGPAQAASEKGITCELMKVMAEDIMALRQNGATLDATTQRFGDMGKYPQVNAIMEGYIQDAFRVPVQLDDAGKDKVISMYGTQTYHQCQAHWSSNGAQSTYRPF